MRWSLILSASILIIIPVFSTPIPRFLLRKRGLFEQTLSLTNTTPEELAVAVANILTDDPQPCSHIKDFFSTLMEGEGAPGVTTIGDRAVAGTRKLLNLQSAGTMGLIEIVNELEQGPLTNDTMTCLIQALSNKSRTLASLKTYKALIDSQSAFGNLTSALQQLEDSDLTSLMNITMNVIQPTLLDLENTIDKFGADFSVQDTTDQATDLQHISALVQTGTSGVQQLKQLNLDHQHTIDQFINTAQGFMNELSAAATEATSLANQPPDIPPEQFTGRKGNACTVS